MIMQYSLFFSLIASISIRRFTSLGRNAARKTQANTSSEKKTETETERKLYKIERNTINAHFHTLNALSDNCARSYGVKIEEKEKKKHLMLCSFNCFV